MILRTIQLLFVCMCMLYPVWSEGKSIQANLTSLAEESGKAVVNISAVRKVDSRERLRELFRLERQAPPFEEFLDRFQSHLNPEMGALQRSMGSGFLISTDGYIVTNNHLVAGAEEITVLLHNDDNPRQAAIVGYDTETDLALLKIDAPSMLSTLAFANSDQARVGEWVLAIGNPFGLDHSVTLGIISAKGRALGAGLFDDFIQTDTSINPGNSGGPLINLSGGVVGINTAIMAHGQGISFAVSSNLAKQIIHELRTRGRVMRGWLGVSVQDVDSLMAKALALPSPGGALISGLTPNAAADKAGMHVGDVILRLGYRVIEDSTDLLRTVAAKQPGQEAIIVVWRKGLEQHLTVTVGNKDDMFLEQATRSEQAETASTLEGLIIRPITETEGKRLGLNSPQGLLVLDVRPGSAAEHAGVQPGDLIMQATRRAVRSLKEFRSIVDHARKETGTVMLLIRRGSKDFFVTLALR
ncbi:Do family serine endopeptidase [Desulfocurvibacter africanus]|uniref:Do family serine endopeptidase n=1 Tax=Desulfocurvibacter africanus TaxID=873 RepID=UPI0003FC2C2E|nr:Do family serine endopeptidase [Desulfocurvibacter africanus]